MKKLFTLVAAIFGLALNASAQIWLDGQFGLYNQKTTHENSDDEDGAFHFVIAPDLGGGINADWAWGCTLKFDHAKYTHNDTEMSENAFSINPYLRRTLVTWDKVSMFADGMVSFGISGVKDVDDKTKQFGVGIAPGVHYAFCEKAGLVSRLGYLGFRHSGNDSQKTNWFGVDFVSSITFGIYWWL